MRLELLPREHVSPLRAWLTPALALLVALALGGLTVWLLGRSPAKAFDVYLVQPLTQGWAFQEILLKATPLMLIGVGLSFCYRADRWNIGAEGQFVMGGLAAGGVAIASHGAGGWWTLPLMLAAGTLAGMAWAAIPALLRNRLSVSEILTSLMLVYVAQLLLDWLVRGPWRDRSAFNFPQSVMFDVEATLPAIMAGGRAHWGLVFGFIAALVAWFVLSRTLFGFAVRAVGEAPRAARFGGFDEKRITLTCFLISGGLAGLAGMAEVSGQIGQLQPSISPGYGFTAIIVAFLGRLSPPGIVLASFVMALILIGAEGAQIALKLPLDLARLFQGLLLFCLLAGEALTRRRLVLAR
ncbi:MAG: ABC transporter permease [Beijerinckiaceae bacterium]